MILKQDGTVWSTIIRLYDPNPSHESNKDFAKVIISGATAIAAGNYHSIVLKQDDSVWVTGQNSKGQLGDGTRDDKYKFTFAKVIYGAKAVAAGGYHTLVLTHEGQVWATGSNEHGQLGAEQVSFEAPPCIFVC